MNQDESYTSVIIGIASDAAKAISVWEALGELFSNYMDEVIEALTPIAEAFGKPLDALIEPPYLSAEELEDLFKQTDDGALTSTSPRKYGMSLLAHPRKTAMHYNYIPRAPKNLPYQRRTY